MVIFKGNIIKLLVDFLAETVQARGNDRIYSKYRKENKT